MICHEFRCVKCRQCLRFQIGYVRPKIKCPKCGASFRIPGGGLVQFTLKARVERMAMFMGRSRN